VSEVGSSWSFLSLSPVDASAAVGYKTWLDWSMFRLSSRLSRLGRSVISWTAIR